MEVAGGQDAEGEGEGGEGEAGWGGLEAGGQAQEEGGERAVAEDACEPGEGAAGANGTGPAGLVFPGIAPAARGFAALHDDGTEVDGPSGPGDSLAEGEVVGQERGEGGESADVVKDLAAEGHDGAEAEVLGGEGAGL